ncbi:MAG: putative sulfate exporter family transporter [Spirochaetales bacterium]|nr:putative sulfate exporter family transporter [Spirochaetales bacterium]
MKKLLPLIPGISIATIITVIAITFTKFVSPYPGAVTITIITGILVGNLPLKRFKMDEGALFLEKKILPISIALLGSELNFIVLKELGVNAILFTISYILLVIGLNLILGKIFRFSFKQGLLLGIGNAVCGSSAIAASSGVINPKDEEIGLSVAAVNLAGVAGIFLMPAVAKIIGYTDLQTSAIIGGTLQAISQTAAAGYAISDEVGNVALIFKMERVAMLGPIVLLLVLISRIFFLKKSTDTTEEDRTEQKAKETPLKIFFKFVPPFILSFIVIAAIANSGKIPAKAVNLTQIIGITLLTYSMTGLGMRIKLKDLFKSGIKVISAQTIALFLQIGIAVGLIWIFGF